MGNLACLNCFKPYEPANGQYIGYKEERMSDIKLLDDLDVVSHIDLDKYLLKTREESNAKETSQRHIDHLFSKRAKSLDLYKKPFRVRLSLHIHPGSNVYKEISGFMTPRKSQPGDLVDDTPSTLKDKVEGENFGKTMKADTPMDIPEVGLKKSLGEGRDGRETPKNRLQEELEELGGLLDSPSNLSLEKQPKYRLAVDDSKGKTKNSRVRSHKELSDASEKKDEVKDLKGRALIEGRKPALDVRSLSIDKSQYSLKTCKDWDNLTFNSLVSGGGNSSLRRLTQSSAQISKRDLFQDFMFEIESFGEYFGMAEIFPLEETIKDGSDLVDPHERILVTFCPKIKEFPIEKMNRVSKKRLIVSRGMFILRKSQKELLVRLNQKREGSFSRFIMKRLQNCSDFDNEADALIKYIVSLGEAKEQLKAVRIGMGKRYSSGKELFYTYERSVDLADFYKALDQEQASLLSKPEALARPFLLRGINRMEVLNKEYIKVDFYNEFYFPEQVKLAAIRKTLIHFYTLID
jgi:hypothetical protein